MPDRTISASSRLVRWTYGFGNEEIPPVVSLCGLIGRLLVLIPLVAAFGIICAALFLLLSPVLLGEYVATKWAARSNPEAHRRKALTGATRCPIRFRVTDLPRIASKCADDGCICQSAPEYAAGIGWRERFHCPACGRARHYGPNDGLRSPCFMCKVE